MQQIIINYIPVFIIDLANTTYFNIIDMSCCDDHIHGPQGSHNHEGHNHEGHNHEEEHHHEEGEEHDHQHQQSEHTEQSPSLLEEKRKKFLLNQKKKAAEKAELKKRSAQLKKKYFPLLKFMNKNGLQFKMASIKDESVQYFRMDEFKKIIADKKDKVDADPVISQLLKSWSQIFFYYKRVDGQPHLKWPVQLQNSTEKQGKFASFPFDSSESSKVMTIFAMVAILAILCFPLWPYEVKYYMWLLSLWSTIFFIVIFFLRLVIYLFGAVFGGSFWIFPRLLQNIGFLESWKPVYSWSWWEGSNVYSVITRVAVLGIFIYYGMHIYSDPLFIRENLDITKTIIDDINDWGISKMKGERNFSQSALTDYSQLLNTTLAEDDNEEDVQGYKSPEVQL